MEPKKGKGNLYFYLVVFGILFGTFIGLVCFTEGGRKAFNEIIDIERIMVPLGVMFVLLVGGLWVALKSEKKNPTSHCPTCGQEFPEDKKSVIGNATPPGGVNENPT